MGAIIVPRSWESQPHGVAEVDWGHPFLRDALAVVDPLTGTERVTGEPLTKLYGNERISAGELGLGFYTGLNAKWQFAGRPPPDILYGREVSMFALTTLLATPTQTYAAIVGTQAPTQVGLLTKSPANNLHGAWIPDSTQIVTGLVGGKSYVAYGRVNK